MKNIWILLILLILLGCSQEPLENQTPREEFTEKSEQILPDDLQDNIEHSFENASDEDLEIMNELMDELIVAVEEHEKAAEALNQS